MEKKMGKLTKTGVVFLVLSFLTWLGFVACIYAGLGSIVTSASDVFETLNMTNQLFMAEIVLAGSVAMPLVFAELFSAQAKEKMSGMVVSAVLLAAWLIYTYKDTAELVFNGATSAENLATLLAGMVVPVLAIIAILLSNRPLAIIAAVLSVVATIANVSGVSQAGAIIKEYGAGYTTASFKNIQTLLTVLPIIAEIIYGLGMFFGLLGVKKHGKTVD